jgi:hypothetical protein
MIAPQSVFADTKPTCPHGFDDPEQCDECWAKMIEDERAIRRAERTAKALEQWRKRPW